MAEKYTTAVEIDVSAKDSGNSVKSIKTELREAKAEAIAMARTFGEGSKEANNAAKKVAQLKDEVEDLGIKIKGVNPDKFSRIASIGQGVAQGFVAAQGAMALFGSESKDLEKTMVKLQGAIALSQGLQGLKDLQLALSGVSIYVKAFAVALTLIIKYWKEFSDAVKSIFPQFQLVIDFFNNFKQIAAGTINAVKAMFSDLGSGIVKIFKGDFAGAIVEFGKIGADMATSFNEAYDKKDKEIKLQNGIKERQFMIALLEAQGKDVLYMRLKLQQDELSLLEKGSDEYNAKLIEIERTRKAILDKQIEDAKAREDAKLKAFEDAQKKIVEDSKFNDDRDKQQAEERKKWNEEQNKIAVQQEADLIAQVARLQAEADAAQKKRDADKLEAEKQYNELRFAAATAGLNAITDIYSSFAAKNEEAQKRAFEVQKAANIATTIIDTYTAAQGAYKAQMSIPTPDANVRAAIAAGIAIAAGLGRLAKIKATTFTSTSTASPTTAGAYQPPTITQNVQQQRQLTQTTTGATGTGRQSNDIKVIVTETDITRLQNRTKGIERRAKVI